VIDDVAVCNHFAVHARRADSARIREVGQYTGCGCRNLKKPQCTYEVNREQARNLDFLPRRATQQRKRSDLVKISIGNDVNQYSDGHPSIHILVRITIVS
jgi:hypothetical protein